LGKLWASALGRDKQADGSRRQQRAFQCLGWVGGWRQGPTLAGLCDEIAGRWQAMRVMQRRANSSGKLVPSATPRGASDEGGAGAGGYAAGNEYSCGGIEPRRPAVGRLEAEMRARDKGSLAIDDD
jgi:hypothetical protein